MPKEKKIVKKDSFINYHGNMWWTLIPTYEDIEKALNEPEKPISEFVEKKNVKRKKGKKV